MKFFNNNISSVLLIFLVVLANAQRSSNSLRDVDFQELARQNKITKQILEAYLQKKLGLRTGPVRAPSISEILPMRTVNESRRKQEKMQESEDYRQDEEQPEQGQEGQEYVEDDSLQSVESEQIDSIYNEGRKKYPTPPFEPELEATSYLYFQMVLDEPMGVPVAVLRAEPVPEHVAEPVPSQVHPLKRKHTQRVDESPMKKSRRMGPPQWALDLEEERLEIEMERLQEYRSFYNERC